MPEKDENWPTLADVYEQGKDTNERVVRVESVSKSNSKDIKSIKKVVDDLDDKVDDNERRSINNRKIIGGFIGVFLAGVGALWQKITQILLGK